MNNDYTLRNATVHDAAKIYALVLAADPHPWSMGLIEEALQTRQNWVIECSDSGELIGWLTASALFDQSELELIVTRLDWRRRGLAKRLLTIWFDWALAQNCDEALLEVRASNHGAIRLYTALGFERVGERKHYYPMPEGGFESALLMTRKLR